MQFIVEDMSCGHCVGTITKAIQQQDAAAKVKIDLVTKEVQIESKLTAAQAKQTIENAGYSVK